MTRVPDDPQISAVADMFHLLGDPTRLKIVYSCLHGARSAGEIASDAGASPSLVSHHLRLLKAARLVRSERRGRQVFYEAADHHIRHVLGDMIDHLNEPEAAEKMS